LGGWLGGAASGRGPGGSVRCSAAPISHRPVNHRSYQVRLYLSLQVEMEGGGKWESGGWGGSPKADSDRPLPRDFPHLAHSFFHLLPYFFVQELLIINSF